MKLCSVEINNYKGIEHLEMSFQDGVNLIIGNNGAGKTSLLQGVAVTLLEPLELLSGMSQINVLDGDERITTKVVSGTVMQSTENYPVELKAKLELNGTQYECGKRKDSKVAVEESINFAVSRVFKAFFEADGENVPLLCFQSANRIHHIVRIKKGNSIRIATNAPERIQGYKGALNSSLALNEIEQWCLQMDFAEYQRKEPIKEYSSFRHIVSNFMKEMDDKASEPRVYYSSTASSLVYSDGKEEKPLYQLSAGYQSVLSTILELAYRTVLLNPNIGENTEDLEGIVLMDEPDLHLHPEWQWKILGALNHTFPKVQFIVATHSPIILASAKDASIQLLKTPNEAVTLAEAYGYSINDVLALRQSSTDMAPELQEYYNRAEAIMDHGKPEELERLIHEASTALKANPVALKGFKDFIEVNRWIEED